MNLNGKKVKINTDKIIRKGYPLSKKFKRFITTYKDDVFTAKESNIGTKITGVLYELEEDNSPVKWLFYVDDLVVVE